MNHVARGPDRVVPATEADRDFARLLREVREGASFVITVDGRPVARLEPTAAEPSAEEQAAEDAKREAAREALFKRLASQTPMRVGRWTRDEMYDD